MTVAVVLALCLSALAASGPASASSPYAYSGAATVVTQVTGETIVDNGVVQCTLSTNSGTGGFCVPFADLAVHGNHLTVTDGVSGPNVSYQVCLDNNGNGICGDAGANGTCADEIWFSHSSDPAPAYRNPMTVATTAAAGCAGSRGFDGLVVFVCTGVDNDHMETGTSGTAALQASGGSGGFTEPGPPVPFCGGDSFTFKSYVVTPKAQFTSFGFLAATLIVDSPLGVVPSTTVPRAWSLSGTLTGTMSGPLDMEGLLGPVAGVGATCTMSRGYRGTGSFNGMSLSDIGWENSAGGIAPLSGQWTEGADSGAVSGFMQLSGNMASCASDTADEFAVAGAIALL